MTLLWEKLHKNAHNTKVRLKSTVRNWTEWKTIIIFEFQRKRANGVKQTRRNVLRIYMMVSYAKLIDDLQLKDALEC